MPPRWLWSRGVGEEEHQYQPVEFRLACGTWIDGFRAPVFLGIEIHYDIIKGIH